MGENAEHEPDTLMTGVDYSLLLVRYTQDYLYERDEQEPTHNEIADYIGTTSEIVTALLRGEQMTLGREFFERVATQTRKNLTAFLRDLIKWQIGRSGPNELLL